MTQRPRYGRVVLACALVLAGASADLWAQRCDPSLRGLPVATGYRARPYGCEGLYIGLQSAPLAVQVVSLIKGDIAAGAGDDQLRLIPPPGLDLANFSADVQVIGRAREPNLNWALHGTTKRDQAMQWDLEQVVHPETLELSRLGIAGQTRRKSGVGPPVFVPLAVVSAGRSVEPSDSLELVLRILEATEACVSSEDQQLCAPGRDSYFTFRLPPGAPGAMLLQVRWRSRLSPAMGDPEIIRIFRW